MDTFVAFVEKQALAIGKHFILDSGDGRETKFDGMEVEDLTGWLLTEEQLQTIPCCTREERNALLERDDLPFVFVIWRIEGGELKVDFVPGEEFDF